MRSRLTVVTISTTAVAVATAATRASAARIVTVTDRSGIEKHGVGAATSVSGMAA
jgi:hypothetical protein